MYHLHDSMSMPKGEAVEATAVTPRTVAEVEERVFREAMDRGLADLAARLQEMADATPCEGSDGRRLRRTRRIGMEVDTTLGKARVTAVCGQCKSTGGWETPFRDRLFRGERGAVSPAPERRIVTTVCETGSFEKAAKVCGAWGCELSDDKAMATARRVGDACDPALLPERCDCAAGEDDVLVLMMDGWMARHREGKWGRKNAPAEERVAWHEIKSAVMFRLSQVAEVSRGRRMLITKHVVAAPAGTDPVEFGRRVQDEAGRMGLDRAGKAYVIMDGGAYLWGVFRDRFADVAVGQLDYYHASQHLHALAEALFPDESRKDERDAWTRRLLKNLKTWGPKTLMDAIADAGRTEAADGERREAVRRESEYFRSHADHMDYRTARREGVPIGSGAMESQCSQNQNRFKRRGQFWSKAGFASFLRAYVWYTNDELKCLYRRTA